MSGNSNQGKSGELNLLGTLETQPAAQKTSNQRSKAMSESPAALRQELLDQIPPLMKEAAYALGLILDRTQMIEEVDAKMEGREQRFVHLEYGFDVSDIRIALGPPLSECVWSPDAPF